ncbi:MAG TPA: zinc ribbon domain-containing protein [Clostridia bacterium]|nr:zinc ribbon domain-containing protein [Clostridia bacterium]
MAFIQFTENHEDLSTENGYQFKFYCDRCRNGYMSTFQASAIGAAGSLLRAAGNIFGGALSSAGSGSYEIQRAIGGKAHDEAMKKAVEEIKSQFHQCKRCGKWVCPDNCWNRQRGMCSDCAPDIQAELAAAQVQATIEQIQEGVRKVDFTKELDLSGEVTATCPKCGARATGKFCLECGTPVTPKKKCSNCSASFNEGAKFCPECGTPAKAAKPKCSGCGMEYETAPKFCSQCGTKM